MELKRRIQQLQKQMPSLPPVGLAIRQTDGWTAVWGRAQAHFDTQEQALAFLHRCGHVILIDV